jgi:hypothetical protein
MESFVIEVMKDLMVLVLNPVAKYRHPSQVRQVQNFGL